MKQRFTHLLALLALGVGVYGILSEVLFAGPDSVTQTQVQSAEKKVRVWRLSNAVRSGQNFASGLVSADTLNESEAGYVLSELPYGKGAVFRLPFEPGHILSPGDLVMPQDPDYIDIIIKPDMTPFPLMMAEQNLLAGGIRAGDFVDILSLTSLEQNMAQQGSVDMLRGMDIDVKPLLNQVRILAVQGKTYDDQQLSEYAGEGKAQKVTLVLEVPHQFVSKLTLARRLSALEVYKSRHQMYLPQAQTKDILPGYQGIVELRGTRRG